MINLKKNNVNRNICLQLFVGGALFLCMLFVFVGGVLDIQYIRMEISYLTKEKNKYQMYI
jgi:hypothetical protein